jgi:amino acid adenylation domain-containing protein
MNIITGTDSEQSSPRNTSQQTYPLSFGQEALWIQYLLTPHSPASNIGGSFELEGELDFTSLQQAISHVIARHDSLRTTFCTENGFVVQKISPEPKFDLPLIDLSGTDADTQAKTLTALSDAAIATVFSLEEGPLVRLSLTRLTSKRHILHVTIHHIVADGWSIAVFKRDLSVLYNAYKNGSPIALPPLSIQYGQYVRWERERFERDLSQHDLAYWRKTLSGAPATLNLKPDFPRRKTISDAGATVCCAIEPSLTRALKAYCKSTRITLFVALLTGFASLLHRLSGDRDIVVGTAVTNRHRNEFQDLIGYFLNMLPLRLRADTFTSGDQFAKHVSSVVLGALAHQAAPFEAIVQQQPYLRASGVHPLFQTIFVLNHPSSLPFEMTDLHAVDRPTPPATTTRFDLGLDLTELKEEWIVGELWYRTDMFVKASAQDMVDQLIRTWANLTVRADSPLTPTSIADNNAALVLGQTHLKGDCARFDSCLHSEFEAQVRKTPKKIAVIGQHSSLSYEALNADANRLAQVLRQRGVGQEDVVGISLRRDLNYVVSILAILKVGAACLPLDMSVPKARNQEILARSSTCCIITDAKNLADFDVPLLILDSHSMEAELRAASSEDCLEGFRNTVRGDGLAYIFFTSGSTGRPKGVELTHKSVVGVVLDQNYISNASDTIVLQHSPVTFDASALELWIGLLSGGTCVLSPLKWLTPASLKVLIRQHQITTAFFVPSLFNAFIDEDSASFSGLRELMLGGEAPSVRHLHRLRQLYPQLTVTNVYGPTEAGTLSVAHILKEGRPEGMTIPIGRPLAHTSVYILTPSLYPCRKGVIGEIFVGGPRLARGYVAERKLTAERFLPDPFTGSGERMYRTGDFAFLRPDGLFEFVGRQDRQIKLNGFRIEVSEIEATLVECEQVRNAIVLLHSPAPDIKRLVAFVLSDSSEEDVPEILQAHLRSRLPHYMVPAQLLVRSEWPTNVNGKVDYNALLASIPPRESTQAGAQRCITATEQLLHNIWCQVLKLDVIGREDNFFAIGGNSILALQVISRCVAANLLLTPSDLFECQDIASLAKASDRDDLADVQIDFCGVQPASHMHRGRGFRLPLVTLQSRGTKRPLFFAHPSPGSSFCYLALANALGSDRPVYGFQAQGFAHPCQTPQSIGEMAACYISALKQAQAAGPYLLGGHSLGAVIAFEMARQLTHRNEEVRCLLLLDCVAPVFEWEPNSLEEDERALLFGTITTLERFTGKTFGLQESLIGSLPTSQGYSLLYHKLREVGFLSDASDESYIERLLDISRAGLDAYKKYRPLPWNGGGVTLFRAATPILADFPGPIGSALNHPYYRWDELLVRPPNTILVPGDHVTMLTYPNVSCLASSIASRLVEADSLEHL